MVEEVLTFIKRHTAELRRGNGVLRQLEYALASFVKEMKKGEGE
jgi:hypothetical protein